MNATSAERTPHTGTFTGGYVLTLALAVVVGAFGLAILLGGIWLIGLGGTWYYAAAGLGLCLTAWFLAQPSMSALWIYLATYLLTLVWAYWEVGFDPWLQVPRLLAPTIVLVLVLLTLPVLRSGRRRHPASNRVRGMADAPRSV